MQVERDVLVIGGGAAAVRAALEARLAGARVLMVDKGRFERSGTSPLALHGLLTALHESDSEAILERDIEQAGGSISDMDLVRQAVQASRTEPAALEGYGVQFLRRADGSYDLYKGAGHTVPHGLTFEESQNGLNFVSVLGKAAWKAGVALLDGVMVTDLIVRDSRVLGAVGLTETGEVCEFTAGAVVLAAGGANRLYPNGVPRLANPMYRTTGDGYVLALRAGLPLVDMEFANFRDSPPANRFGRYVNARGEAIMEKYDPDRLDRAPRGKVVEAIYQETQLGNGPIFVRLNPDAEQAAAVLTDEARAYVRAALAGNPPPVTITFQRLLGGARISPDASTAVAGLFIAGENAGGFNGADRLQGASFLETQVFGRLAGVGAAAFCRAHPAAGMGAESPIAAGVGRERGAARARLLALQAQPPAGPFQAGDVIREIQQIMWDSAAIFRDQAGLVSGLRRLAGLRDLLRLAVPSQPFEALEAENLLVTAEVVLNAALLREETRGTHRRSDFPSLREDLSRQHTSVSLQGDGTYQVTFVPSRG